MYRYVRTIHDMSVMRKRIKLPRERVSRTNGRSQREAKDAWIWRANYKQGKKTPRTVEPGNLDGYLDLHVKSTPLWTFVRFNLLMLVSGGSEGESGDSIPSFGWVKWSYFALWGGEVQTSVAFAYEIFIITI